MDPNANLREQLEIARKIQGIWDNCPEGFLSAPQRKEVADMADCLSELVIALDEWIRKGGFLPEPWRKAA